jgi:hypothetical protein
MDVPQHFTACFNSPRAGSTSSFLTGNTWFMYYNQMMGNALLIETDAIASGVSSNNINAIAKVIRAKGMFELASIWDEIPFTEALDGNSFPSPQFDSQETVFKGCVDILDEAAALINGMEADGNFNVASGDLVYGGDMDKWLRYTNSLKLRILMLIRNKDTSVDGEITTLLGQPLMESNDQAALIRYADTPAESNGFARLVSAFFSAAGNEVEGVYAPGPALYSLLEGDPRFDLFIADPDGMGSPGIGQFTFNNPGSATISNNVIRNDFPQILLLPSEVSLYKAELALLGVTSDDADTQFKNGVRQHIEFWSNSIPGAQKSAAQADIDAFVDGLASANLTSVHEQLYVESFMRPVIAWNTVRRTAVPELDEVPGTSISSILKRFNYPPDEIASNPNTPVNLPTDTKVWFEN